MGDLHTPWSEDDGEIIDGRGNSVTGAMCTFSDKAEVYVDGIINRVNAFEANEALIKELVEALKAAQELAVLAHSLTGCRSDDEYVSGVQDKIEVALAKAEARL